MDNFIPYSQYVYKKKKRKRALIALTIIFFVLVAAGLVALAAFSLTKPKIDAVRSTFVTEVTTDSVSLRWSSVDDADGYIIYSRKLGEDYKKAATLEKTEYTFKKLEQATEYKFYVVPYNEKITGKEYTEQSAFTLPEAPKLTLAHSRTEGIMDIEWEANKNADSYTLQYKTLYESDYSDAEVLKFGKNETTAELDGLGAGVVYNIRLRAVVKHGGETLESAWSKKSATVYREEISVDHIDPNKPMIALTFDDGPSYGTANARILKALVKNKAKATFFMIGENVTVHPENVKRKAELGMELGNHTWDHTHEGEDVTAEDIRQASQAIFEVTGQPPTVFRSPYGFTTDSILAECEKENMPAFYWSVDTEDWKSRNAKKIYKQVMKEVKDGDIILMHEIYDSTAEAVELLLPKLIKKGYQFVTCSELIKAKYGEMPYAGLQYSSGRF